MKIKVLLFSLLASTLVVQAQSSDYCNGKSAPAGITNPVGICPAYYMVPCPRVFIPPIIDGNIESDAVWTINTLGGFNILTKDFEPVVGSVLGISGLVSRKLLQPININSTSDVNHNPIDYSSSSFSGHSASFGLLWDTTYLYVAVHVKDPKVASSSSAATFSRAEITMYFNAQYPDFTQATTSGNYDLTKALFPRLYNNDFESQIGLKYLNSTTPNINLANGSFLNYGGFSFNSSHFDASIAKTAVGYIIEARFKWSQINYGYQDIITQIVPEMKRPKVGKTIGFDIGNSISNLTGDTRIGEYMWNNCCLHRNWSESRNFGALVLTNTPYSLDGPQTLSIVGLDLISPNQTQAYSIAVSPENSSLQANWTFYKNADIATFNANTQEISALKYGIVTVCAISLYPNTLTGLHARSCKIVTIVGIQQTTSSLSGIAVDQYQTFTLPSNTDQGLSIMYDFIAGGSKLNRYGNEFTALAAGLVSFRAHNAGNAVYEPFEQFFNVTITSRPYTVLRVVFVTVSGTSLQNLKFSWQPIVAAKTYCIQIAQDTSFNTLLKDTCGIEGDSFTFTSSNTKRLRESSRMELFYRIKAVDSLGNVSSFSNISSISVDATSDDITFVKSTVQNDLKDFKVIPNPVESYFEIKGSTQEDVEVEMYNVLGDLVFQRKIGTNTRINDINIKPGTYYIKLTQTNGSVCRLKLVK